MLDVEPAQYLRVAVQVLQIVLDLCVVLSLDRKLIFPCSGSKRCWWVRIAAFIAIFEDVTMSMSHVVCLDWKFPSGGRKATFLN